MAPPAFVQALLGYTARGKPNTADGDSAQSVAIAERVLQILSINGTAPGAQTGGAALENGVHGFLVADLPNRDPNRAWVVERGGAISRFQQYAHLARLDRTDWSLSMRSSESKSVRTTSSRPT